METIKRILQSKKYDVKIVFKLGIGHMACMENVRGLTGATIDRRLKDTGLECTRHGWDMRHGFYMFIIDRRDDE